MFIENKSSRPLLENYWSIWYSKLPIDCYMKITRMSDRQSAEFYYKLLHDYLNNNLSINMGNSKVQKFCDNCREIGNVNYLIYECSDSYLTW